MATFKKTIGIGSERTGDIAAYPVIWISRGCLKAGTPCRHVALLPCPAGIPSRGREWNPPVITYPETLLGATLRLPLPLGVPHNAIGTVSGRVEVNTARYPNRNGKEILPEEPLKIPAYPARRVSPAGAGRGTSVIANPETLQGVHSRSPPPLGVPQMAIVTVPG